MSEDIFNALTGIEDQMTRIAVALEREAEPQPTLMPLIGTTKPYPCPTCDGSGTNPHTFASCEDCNGDGDHLLSAMREIRNTLNSSASYQHRIAVALEAIAEARS